MPNLLLNIAINAPILSDTTIPYGTEDSIWTNQIQGDIISFKTSRGRQHQADRIEAGTLTLELENSSGKYWRYNTASPLFGPSISLPPNIAPGAFRPVTLVQLCGLIGDIPIPIFTGIIEQIKPGWIDTQVGKSPIVTISISDIFKTFSYYDLPSFPFLYPFYRAPEISGDRLNFLLDIIGFPPADTLMRRGATYAGYPDVGLAIGQVVIDAIDLKASSGTSTPQSLNLQQHFNEIAKAEQGSVFIAANGAFVFLDAYSRINTLSYFQPQAAFKDTTFTPYQIASPDFVDDDQYVYNIAQIDGNAIHPGVQVGNMDISNPTDLNPPPTTNLMINGPRKYSDTGSLLASKDDAWCMAFKIQNRYQSSALRSQGLMIFPDGDPTGSVWNNVISFDLATCISLQLNSAYNPANINAVNYNIEAIHHEWKVGERWETTYELWNSDAFMVLSASHDGYWKSGDGVNSYADAQAASNATNVYTDSQSDFLIVGQYAKQITYSEDIHKVYRAYIEFDTTLIPSTPAILNAWIALNIEEGQEVDNRPFSLCVVDPGTVAPAWNATLENGTGTLDTSSPLTLTYGQNYPELVQNPTPAAGAGSFFLIVPPGVIVTTATFSNSYFSVTNPQTYSTPGTYEVDTIYNFPGGTNHAIKLTVGGTTSYGLQLSDFGKLLSQTTPLNTPQLICPMSTDYSLSPTDTMYISNGSGVLANSSPQQLYSGMNVVDIATAGTFNLILPSGATAGIYSGTMVSVGSPRLVSAGTSTITTSGTIGYIIIIISGAGQVYLPLNAAGLALINLGGYTRFALRSDHDIAASPPIQHGSEVVLEVANICEHVNEAPLGAKLIVQFDIYGNGATLVSIAVTPATATIGVGGTQQYTAIGTYSDESTRDITSLIQSGWGLGWPSRASFDTNGLATGLAAGTTAVNACLGVITSPSVTLTVTADNYFILDEPIFGILDGSSVLG